MSRIRRLLRWAFLLSLAGLLIGGAAFGLLYISVSSKLPDVQTLRNIELQEPLYVYARDGRLIGLFGETRRYPVQIEKVPKRLKDAFIAIEDARFYQHGGVDYKGVARAIWLMSTTDDKRVPGGSTITQQVARQFFLSSEYKLKRKFAEMLLARKMEAELSKDEIFELYLNKSFFGNRAYGVDAAAEFYYGKPLDQLSLDEMASLAAIPKFPSSGNPLNNPARARIRRDYVLTRMQELKMISVAEAQAAQAAAMHASPHERPIEVAAPYIAEMVRQEMIARYGEEALTKGYHVTTTIDPVLQAAADKSVRDGLGNYDRRHGWNTKAMQRIELPAGEDAATAATRLRAYPARGPLLAALVLGTTGSNAQVVLADGTELDLGPDTSRWTGKTPAALIKRGDVARVRKIVPELKVDPKAAKPGDAAVATAPPIPTGPVTWRLEQLPRAESALVSLDADTGALRALVGGYSFAGNKFNNATQARRQPGSSFKPFIYAAAFERGYNPASIVLDAPVVFRMRGSKVWRPQNDGGGFAGPIRVREALVQSRNLVSVRMLDAIGVDYARKYISQFGFEEKELPPNLSIALGTPSLTPLSMARGYASFANGGFRITPWLIDEVKDRDGKVIYKEKPAVACRSCGQGAAGQPAGPASSVIDGFDLGPAGGAKPGPTAKPDPKSTAKAAAPPATLPADAVLAPRAIDERIAYQLTSMMRDVVLRGTATDAKRLGREDVGGKTGSTNNHRDAWFSGTGGNLITTVWVGKSDNTSLGYREYGGKAALPIWIEYMKVALTDVPIATNEPPNGMIKVAVTASGQLLPSTGSGGITEYVKVEDLEKMETYIDYGSDDALPSEESFDIF